MTDKDYVKSILDKILKNPAKLELGSKSDEVLRENSPEKNNNSDSHQNHNSHHHANYGDLEICDNTEINESYQNSEINGGYQNSEAVYGSFCGDEEADLIDTTDCSTIHSQQSSLSLLAEVYGTDSRSSNFTAGETPCYGIDAPPSTPIKPTETSSLPELRAIVEAESLKTEPNADNSTKNQRNLSKAKIEKIYYEKRRHKNMSNNFVLCEAIGCDKTFKTLQEHKNHFHRHHSNYENKPQQCEVCKVKFTTMYELKRHKAYIHEKTKEFQCARCGKCFVEKTKLIRHSAIHTDDEEEVKSFKCPVEICGNRYGSHSSLKLHVKNKHLEVYKKMGRKKNVKKKKVWVGDGTKEINVETSEKVIEVEVPEKILSKRRQTSNEFKVPKNLPVKFGNDKNAILADEPRTIQRKRKVTQSKEITPTKLTRKALKELNANLKSFEK